jgi:hypothetical protein
MTDTDQTRLCVRCSQAIAQARIKALPDTSICKNCSEEIGGEYKLTAIAENLAKSGSLKKNYASWQIKLTRRPILPKHMKEDEV